MRVAVVGLGGVGETCAHALVASDVARRLVLMNRTVDLADAIARDLRQARAWGRRLDTSIDELGYEGALVGCDLVVLTLGARLRGGQERSEVAAAAARIYRDSCLVDRLREVARDSPDTVVLVVTNPVEVITTWLGAETGLPRTRIFGLGTTVESARVSQHLASQLDVDPMSAWVHVLGEHGPGIVMPDQGRLSELEDPDVLEPAIERAKARALAIRATSEAIGARAARQLRDQFAEQWSSAPLEALDWLERELASRLMPPATRFAIAAAVVEVARAIATDSERVMTVAGLPPKELDLAEVAISLPFTIRRGGLGRCVTKAATLPELREIAESLRHQYEELGRALAAG